MKTTINKEVIYEHPNYVLNNMTNYKPIIINSDKVILENFVNILIEYIQFITEKIQMKSINHYRFIIERGMDIMINVFNMLFYYTKNLELSIFHTQKAYYFYIEFIEQISDDNAIFLQL